VVGGVLLLVVVQGLRSVLVESAHDAVLGSEVGAVRRGIMSLVYVVGAAAYVMGLWRP
jgi:hypothetical protein